MESLYLLMGSLFVAGLITWRLLIGSHHQGRHERLASGSMSDDTPGGYMLNDHQRADGDYPARSLRICNNPCKAALRLRKKVFLADEAPLLPLPACDRVCHCDYSDHDDRRISRDRRHPAMEESFHEVGPGNVKVDLRSGRDRRRRSWVEPYQGIY